MPNVLVNHRIVRAVFLALVLVSLMVLHTAEGDEMKNAMAEVAKRAQATGEDQLSAQVCVCGMHNGPWLAELLSSSSLKYFRFLSFKPYP